MSGWIKLHRQLMEWEWYQDSNMVHLYLHMLLKANREPKKWKGVIVESGQFISSRDSLSVATGISVQTIRTCIARLQESGLLTIKTTNKYTLFTLIKWGSVVNGESDTNQQANQQLTSNQPAINQQLTTNKKVEKVENTKKDTVVSKKTKRKIGIPDDFAPDYEYAKQCGISNPEFAFEIYRDTAIAKNYLYADWNLAWKDACRSWLPDKVRQAQANMVSAPTEPEPAVEYFEPTGWQKFANEYAEAIRNQIFNEGEGKWENLTPAQQQDLTEKCKEL